MWDSTLQDYFSHRSFTSLGEAHGDGLIRNYLLPMCRGIFFHCCVLFFGGGGEEQNCEGYGPQNGKYLHSWGGVITNSIRAMPQLEVWAPQMRMCVPVRGWIVKDQWEKQS